MSAASEALADVRGWTCDSLSDRDAGKVCSMLSAVSRHISALEEENDNLLKTVDSVMPSLIEDNARFKVENAELRKLARGLNWCTENAKVPSAECERCPLGDTEDDELSCEKLMRELGIEVE